ncbi:MAG: hypothetical protein IPJ41_00765 [Phycisphaerales bacterium]|nr:hypothetical protein [Phycisphaerales bacterium]
MGEADKAAAEKSHSMKETISSLIIAFVFAFVFRGFVVEAFVIPTGSMAPTLLGQHVRFRSPESGATWTTDTWEKNEQEVPAPVQGSARAMTTTDPMTGAQIGTQLPQDLGRNQRTLSGDRIFVLKYLYSIFDPSRFDVVVFKYPGQPGSPAEMGEQQNYIKRLTGLPGEEIALVDGDVFHRPAVGLPGSLKVSDWNGDATAKWEIARKDERTQRALWQPIYDSQYAPLNPERDLTRWFHDPWRGLNADGSTDDAWEIQDKQEYTHSAATPTTLSWDDHNWPIDDRYAYNELPGASTRGPLGKATFRAVFPVSDIRLAMGVKPDQDGLHLAAVLTARGHEFRADIAEGAVRVRMRPVGADESGWASLAEAPLERVFTPGKVTNVEFWHVDQSVQVWIEGKRVANGEYEWSPALRVQNATGLAPSDALAPTTKGNPLAHAAFYKTPSVRWELAGSPVTLYRVRLDRDLYYQPGEYSRGTRAGQASLGTHPTQPLLLGPDQFFVCGDNSPNSLDGRLWDTPDAWVYNEIDPTIGVVNRDLLIGKAFFVYFPSVHKERRIPVPDIGRMRFIW